ncbi:MAG: helix-turn-helix transcriptional regulator [Oscillibacter sp.]
MKYERVRNLREDRDWTQQKVADALHINRRTYSAYETGVNAIPLEMIADIAVMYGTSVDYLLNLTDLKEPYPRKK